MERIRRGGNADALCARRRHAYSALHIQCYLRIALSDPHSAIRIDQRRLFNEGHEVSVPVTGYVLVMNVEVGLPGRVIGYDIADCQLDGFARLELNVVGRRDGPHGRLPLCRLLDVELRVLFLEYLDVRNLVFETERPRIHLRGCWRKVEP